MSKTIKKQQAANAVGEAWSLLYEVSTLLGAAESIQDYHGDGNCVEADAQVRLIRNIAEEKLDEAGYAVHVASDYFNQKPKSRKVNKKKLAVAKAAA